MVVDQKEQWAIQLNAEKAEEPGRHQIKDITEVGTKSFYRPKIIHSESGFASAPRADGNIYGAFA